MSQPKPRPSKRPPKRRNQFSKLLNRIPRVGRFGTIVGIAGIFLGTIAVSLIVAYVLRLTLEADTLNPFQQDVGLPTAVPNATPNPDFLAPTLDIGNAVSWQGTERVTLLLMGSDTRPIERGNVRPHSDSMMLLMVDPVAKQASMLSVPRDLWVDIPGYGQNRINAAYLWGGGTLAVDTVQYNLGVRVSHYALIEFDVFTEVINELDGIDVYVQEEINDRYYPDMTYGYDPFYLPVGLQHLDGETALKYIRTRHGSSDFDRARRQQDVLFAIRDKVLTLDMLPTLIQRSPELYNTLSENIYTDLTLEQMISLVLLAKDIPKENIRTGVIGPNHATDYLTPDGAQVLIPQRYLIGPYLSYVFWLSDDPG